MTVPTMFRSRLALISLALLATLALMFAFDSSTKFLRGSLLDDRVFTLADTNRDGVLSILEMRRAVTNMIAAIALNDRAYELSGNGTTDRTDLTLLLQSIRAHLSAVCGNNVTEASEQCDDGNAVNTDSCTNVCRNAACSDGFIQGSEACDDGNVLIGDGCSATCTVESAFTCTVASPSVCTRIPVCGNNRIEGTEECDDGDTTDTGFCAANCRNHREISCQLPATASGSFIASRITDKSDQVIALDTDADGLYELALRDGMTLRLLSKNSGAPTFTERFSSTLAGTRAFIAASDDRRGVSARLVILSQVPRFPNLSNPNPDYYINTYSVVTGGGDLTSLTNSSRTAPLFTLSRAGGFLGPVYRGTTPSSYAPLERIPNIAQPTNRFTLQQNFLGTGPQNMFQYAKLSKNTLDNGRHLIVTGYGGFSTPREQLIVDDNVNILVRLGVSNYTIVYAIDAVDINGDGTRDIVAAMFDPAQSKFLLNAWDAAGNSILSVPMPNLGLNASMGVTDVDLDGDTDVVLGSETGAFWLEHNGSTWTKNDIRTGVIKDLSVADVTADGFPDVVIATADGTYLYSQLQECVIPIACGNGVQQGTEQCDDGNSDNTDSCTQACRNPSCGDSFRQSSTGEECDDGNTVNTDSCTQTCRNPACGDGFKQGTEQCDDGDTDSTDGCSAVCVQESGFTCTGDAPSLCLTYNQIVKKLADIDPVNAVVSQREALILTIDMIFAPGQPYATVSRFDINGDGVVNQVDRDIVSTELSILAPLP